MNLPSDNRVRVGVVLPSFLISRHNTDFNLVKYFGEIDRFGGCDCFYNQSAIHTFTHNATRLIHRFANRDLSSVHYSLDRRVLKSDVLYHYGTPANSGRLFASSRDIPVVVTTGFMSDRYAEGSRGIPDRRLQANVIAASLQQARKIHFHTECGRRNFLQYRPDFKDRAVSVPFFLPHLDSPRSPLHARRSSDSVKILFVGYEGKRKGLFDLIRAVEILGDQYLQSMNVSLTVVSRDKPSSNLRIPITWFRRLSRMRVLDEMRRADIFVLVPKKEAYGLVLLEAMSSGCAVVTDNDAPRSEILGDAGRQVQPESPGVLSRELQGLIEDEGERRKLGQLASQRVQQKFSPQVVAKQYEQLFRESISR